MTYHRIFCVLERSSSSYGGVEMALHASVPALQHKNEADSGSLNCRAITGSQLMVIASQTRNLWRTKTWMTSMLPCFAAWATQPVKRCGGLWAVVPQKWHGSRKWALCVSGLTANGVAVGMHWHGQYCVNAVRNILWEYSGREESVLGYTGVKNWVGLAVDDVSCCFFET